MSESKLPETCTLLLSLDLTVDQTFDPRTYMATEVTENTTLRNVTGIVQTTTTETEVVLGKGGMGIVKCGQQLFPDREVAIKKVIKQSNNHQSMLLQEAQITGQLEHPSIVPIHQIRQDDKGNIEIIMKKVQGSTLLEQVRNMSLESDYTLPVAQLNHLIQVCFALEYAHSRDIVHRDIKLENIMVGDFNEVFLMDWGLGMHLINRIGANPGIVGTPSYLAPEMLSGNPDDIDVRTDVYLMGATIHHLLIGKPRHDKTKVRETLEQAHDSLPCQFPPHIPSIFEDIVNTACARSKSKRYQTIQNLRIALENALQHWEAIQLTQRADASLNDFEVSIQDDSIRSGEVSKGYLKIRTLYESAIEMWNENTMAHKSMQRLITLMVQYHIKRLEISIAETLFAELIEPEDSLFKQLEKAQTEFAKLSDAHAIAQQYDPLQSKSGRKSLIVSLAATAVLLVSFAAAYSYFVTPEVTTLRLMYTGSVVSISCILGVFIGRKSLLTNKLGAQMARTFTTTSLLATFNHWIGHLNGESPTAIMSIDMFIMAIAFASMKEGIRSAYYIASMGIIFAIIGALYPSVCHPLLLLTILLSSMWALLDWFNEDS